MMDMQAYNPATDQTRTVKDRHSVARAVRDGYWILPENLDLLDLRDIRDIAYKAHARGSTDRQIAPNGDPGGFDPFDPQ
jgi:hypothetical protein